MDGKRPLPNVPQKNFQCEEGAARYVTVGESGILHNGCIAGTGLCHLLIQKVLAY